MYNVGHYLQDYLESLEHQSFGFERLELILVDDGSSDDTLEIATRFAAKHPSNVRVVEKPNGGQASARNLGLEKATGEWVTFPDPDDVLSRHYFAHVAEMMRRGDERVAIYTTPMILWFEATDERRDAHALAYRFRRGSRFVDLDAEPDQVQAHVTTGFLRRDVIDRSGLRFDERLRLRFEDGNFVTRYLLQFDRPRAAFVSDVEYLYRQRADQSSTVQANVGNPAKYTDTLRFGFSGVIDEATGKGRPLPRWAQNLLLYDVFWILRSSQGKAVRMTRFPDSMYEELDELLPAFLRHVDDDAILGFELMGVAAWMRDALLLAKRGSGVTNVHWGREDAPRGLVSVIYRYRGERPQERILAGGVEMEARYTADVDLEYVGRPIIRQRTLWVADVDSIVLELDGERQDILSDERRPTSRALSTPGRRLALSGGSGLAKIGRKWVRFVRRNASREGVRKLQGALAHRVHSRGTAFEDAWVFIDRDVDANDSAEVLYKWVVANRPDINAWFVVRKGTRDWDRLTAEGVRLVDYGSARFTSLLLSAKHLASSHADRFITNPLPKRYGAPGYAFTFLQHGVIKGDISAWLNSKIIDVFVTSTQDEYDYLTEPSPFKFGNREVRLTGLPRFDDLLEQDVVAEADRDTILIMPTWRDYLVGDMLSTSADRTTVADFAATSYASALERLLRHSELRTLARDRGLKVVLMPHPNMRSYLDDFDLPDWIEVQGYEDVDVRSLIVRARAVVTDYSSIAFNAAYIKRPIVYYQFDRDEYFTAHTERPGYFDYETHGFGPVIGDADGVVAALAAIVDHGAEPEYVARMDATFPVRDGRNSERVVAAMEAVHVRAPLALRKTAAGRETWAGVAAR
jgi:glycosyltransferase involved in cell wall biosynthesis